jgi:hypothetical protein
MLVRLAVRTALVTVCAVALALVSAGDSHAGRCSTGLISGGPHCGECPDPTSLPNPCDPGEELVIFDVLSSEVTTPGSSVIIRSSTDSPCGAGFEQQEPVDGYMVACWSPPDAEGCREIHTPNNGYMCLRIKDDPLNCPDECATVRTGQIAISTAGAADRFICPPKAGDATCKSTRGNGVENRFRLWIGGLCSTNGCAINDPNTPSDDSADGNTCTSEWGATLFGYSRGKAGKASPPGSYFWNTGTFDLEVTDGKSTCGTLGECLGRPGNRHPWTLRIVGKPRPGSRVPCLGSDSCSPLPPGDPGCIP